MAVEELRKWSVQTFYQVNDDNGKQFRATAAFHCEAKTIPEAYAIASKNLPDRKLGAIMPGHHLRFP